MPLLSDSAMCSKPPDLALGQEKLFSSGSADVRAFGPGGSAWPVTLFQEHPELGHLRPGAETDRRPESEPLPPHLHRPHCVLVHEAQPPALAQN